MKYLFSIILALLMASAATFGQSAQRKATTAMIEGNQLFEKKRYEAARERYEQGLSYSNSRSFKAKAYHNIGNSYAAENDWKNAVNSYKNALRQNPADKDTKFNLSLAQKKMKEQQQQEEKKKDQDKDKKEKEDKKEEKKDPQKQEEKKDDQKENSNDPAGEKKPDEQNDAKKGPEQNAVPSNNKLTEQRAVEMLNAIQRSEQKVQERKGKKANAVPSRLDKDW